MDYACFSCTDFKSCFLLLPSGIHRRPITFKLRSLAAGVSGGGGGVKCEFGGWTAPLEPRSPAGRRLSGVLLDDRNDFRAAARKELERLAVERDEAVARLQLSRASDEGSLHRRIAELKKLERQVAVEDVIYALILHEFYQIHVYLVPKLSKCVCNGRLEIWPSKDWELETIHSVEILEMVREHVSSVIGWPASSCVKDNWAMTKMQRSYLCKLYAASILFGYFLKSAAVRHRLEWGPDLHAATYDTHLPVPLGSQYAAFGCIDPQGFMPKEGWVSCRQERKCRNLRYYVMGFDEETVHMCAEPKCKEAVSLIERHSHALFGGVGDERLGSAEVITTSFGSVKRLMLEAVAFGGFLWDAEEWVKAADEYMLLDRK